MPSPLLSRYVWIIDTINRYGTITRAEIERLWLLSPISDGKPLPRRTFCKYKDAIEQLFDIDIQCNRKTYEYYIDNHGDKRAEGMTQWLLNSASLSGVVTDISQVADRIYLEDVPSARTFLNTVLDALKNNRVLSFDYYPYTRSRGTKGIQLEPYFLKIWRQRWYVIGRNVQEKKIKTYALDRMDAAKETTTEFKPDPTFDANEYVASSFGVIYNDDEVYDVKIKTEPRAAKYLRALPLHSSQTEQVHDDYSIFSYRLRLTPDLVNELMSRGPTIEVLSPPSLRMTIKDQLAKTLHQYDC